MADTRPSVLLTYDLRNAYVDTNVPDGIAAMHDGNLDVNADFGFNAWNAVWAVSHPFEKASNTRIDRIRLRDKFGAANGTDTQPIAILQELFGAGDLVPITTTSGLSTFDGSGFDKWWEYVFATPIYPRRLAYQVTGKTAVWFTEFEYYGAADEVPEFVYQPLLTEFKQDGANGNTYDWANNDGASSSYGDVDETKAQAVASLGPPRAYLQQTEMVGLDETDSTRPDYTGQVVKRFSPAIKGWRNVELLRYMVQRGLQPRLEIINSLPEQNATYPNLKTGAIPSGDTNNNSAPRLYSADPLDPASYAALENRVFNVAALAGSNTDPALLAQLDWTKTAAHPSYQGPPTIAVGTVGLKYLGVLNENTLDYRPGQYIRPQELVTINYVAKRAIRRADPTMGLRSMALHYPFARYIRAYAWESGRRNGYDATTGLPKVDADIITYHAYFDNDIDGTALPFERSAQYAPSLEFWRATQQTMGRQIQIENTETGYSDDATGIGTDNVGNPVEGYRYVAPAAGRTSGQRIGAWHSRNRHLHKQNGVAYVVYGFHRIQPKGQYHYWDTQMPVIGEPTQFYFQQEAAWLDGFTPAGIVQNAENDPTKATVVKYIKAGSTVEKYVAWAASASPLSAVPFTLGVTGTVTPSTLRENATTLLAGAPVAATGSYAATAGEVPLYFTVEPTSTTTPPSTGGGTTTPPSTGGGTTTPPSTGGGTTTPPSTGGGGTTTPPDTTEPEPEETDPDDLVLLVAIGDFKPYVAFSTNIAPLLVEPYIRDAQLHDVYPLLPAALRTELETPKADWSEATGKFFKKYIRPLLVCEAAGRMMLWHGTHVTPAGLEDLAQDGIRTPAGDKRRAELKADLQGKAATYRAKLLAALPKPATTCSTPNRRPGRGGVSFSAV